MKEERTVKEKEIMKELRIFMYVDDRFRKRQCRTVCVHFKTQDGRVLHLHYDPETLALAVSDGISLFFNKLYNKFSKFPKETWHTAEQAEKEIGFEPYADDITKITYCRKVLYERGA